MIIALLAAIAITNAQATVAEVRSASSIASPPAVDVPIEGVETECFEETAPVPWSYCVNRDSDRANPDLVYHFHGLNGSVRGWNHADRYSGKIHAHWLKMGIAPPTVVTVSFGSAWLLTERKDRETGGLYPVFLESVMARVEARIASSPIRRRLLVGESMGGINAMSVALRSGHRFAKVAALCPPLPTVSPYARFGEMVAYLRRNHIGWDRLARMFVLGRRFNSGPDSWRASDPVELSKHFVPAEGPALYLTCSADDEWGCLEGSAEIVKNVRAAGGEIQWEPRRGGHCADIPEATVAEFLAL